MFLFVVIHNAMTRAEGALCEEEVIFVPILPILYSVHYIWQTFKSSFSCVKF